MTIIKHANKTLTIKSFFILLLLLISVILLTTLPTMPEESVLSTISWSEYKQAISEFEAEDRRLIEKATVELNRYFDEMECNIDPFLDDIYSLTSKLKMLWYLLKDIEFKNIDNLSPYLMMMPPVVPVRSGTNLPGFIEEKFDHHFGGTYEINQQLNILIGDIAQELKYNNERLAVELGELVPATLKDSGKLSDRVADADHFTDRARELSTTIVARTTGLQAGIEVGSLAIDIMVTKSIAGYVISVLAAEGLIVAEGIASGVVTFGIGAAIAIAIDIVANNISKSTLRPKIEQAIAQRRQETITEFRKLIVEMVNKFHHTRRRAIEDTLNVGVLLKVKNSFLL